MCRAFHRAFPALPPNRELSANLLRMHLIPVVQIVVEDINQDWTQYRALGNPTCQLSLAPFASTLQAQPSSLYCIQSVPAQDMDIQFLQENAVENGVKMLLKPWTTGCPVFFVWWHPKGSVPWPFLHSGQSSTKVMKAFHSLNHPSNHSRWMSDMTTSSHLGHPLSTRSADK